MSSGFSWRNWDDLRPQLPAAVADAIDAVRRELGHDADTDAVISALRQHETEFMYAIMGLVVIKDVPLGDAKWIVHGSSAYADGSQDREDSWAAMYDEVMNDPEVRQQPRNDET